MNCSCNSGLLRAECCGPFLDGESWPETAEALMRARYAAYASGNVDFIHDSTEPSARGQLDRKETEAWSKQADWRGFEVLATEGGGPDDQHGSVEFLARYAVQEVEQRHHELATFERIDGKWYFFDGKVFGAGTYRREVAKTGRNDPCPCGSGKKFKKCHGGAGAV